jgi:hypothetical protein
MERILFLFSVPTVVVPFHVIFVQMLRWKMCPKYEHVTYFYRRIVCQPVFLYNKQETVKACWCNCKTIMASPVILFHLLQHEREQQQLELKTKTISFPLNLPTHCLNNGRYE